MFHIKLINHQDVQIANRIYAILLLAYEQEVTLMGIDDCPALKDSVNEIQARNDVFWGAFYQQELVGVLSFREHTQSAQTQIMLLIIHPKNQRQGIAKLLLAELKRLCSTPAISVLTGLTNIPALSLYLQSDFVPYHVQPAEAPFSPLISLCWIQD